MSKIFNLNNVPHKYVEQFGVTAKTLFLGGAAGSEKIYVNIDQIPPGLKSAKYHSHSRQEEFFLILGGVGKLRMNGEEYAVQKGDFVAKPAGRQIAHQFINTGTETLEILDVGTNEEGDVAHYPDEDIYLMRDQRIVLKGDSKLVNWDSDPNS